MKSQLFIHLLLLALITFPTFSCNDNAEEDHHDEDEGDDEDYEEMEGDDDGDVEYSDDEDYEDYPEDYHIEL